MNIFLIVELILRSLNMWQGLKDYINQKELDQMRQDLLRIHEDEENIKKANDENSIKLAQASITHNSN